MKHRNKMMRIALYGFVVMAVAGMTCHATILIDYVDTNTVNGIHDFAVRDGAFEVDTAPPSPFTITNGTGTVWDNTGNGDWQLRTNLNSPEGGQNAVVGVDATGLIDQRFGQDTGHVLALGDQFNGSFGWRDASGWGVGETIDMFLYYTADNTLNGARTTLFTLNSGDETVDSTWETETLALTAAVADAGAVGKKLFVSFEGNNADANSFARLDNVYLQVIVSTPLPPEWIEDPIAGNDGLFGRDYTGSLAGKVTEPNGDVVTFTRTAAGPAWLSVDPASGALTGTPDVLGTNTFTVVATDADGSDSAVLNIFVSQPSAPSWDTDPVDGGTNFVDQPYSGSLAGAVTEPDGDAITYAIDSGPAWLAVDPDNGTLSGTPDTIGTDVFTVSATDIDGSNTAQLEIVVIVAPTPAGGILIDYVDTDAGNGIHDVAVRDGAFELDTPNDGGFGVTNGTYWAPITGAGTTFQIRDNKPSPNGGGNNTVIGLEGDGTTYRQLGQDTGHVLALGDRFNSAFDWNDASGGWAPDETIDMFLYYTADDTLNGARTTLFTHNSGSEVNARDWDPTVTFATTAAVADAGAVGKKLFVSFEPNGVNASSWARLDNVFLQVIADVPTPPVTDVMIAGPILGGTAMEISWTSVTNKPYGVQTNSNLIITGGWNDFQTGLMGNGGILSVTNIIGPDQIFYRVISE